MSLLKKNLTMALWLVAVLAGYCQTLTGDQHKHNGDLEAAIAAYKMQLGLDPSDRKIAYNLASVFALTYYQKDSAFHYLEKALVGDSALMVLTDSDFVDLLEDERWGHIEKQQMFKYNVQNPGIKNKTLALELLKRIALDQSMDYFVHQARTSFMENGHVPHWFYPINAMKRQYGKDNYAALLEIIDLYGWPGYSVVGELAADAPLLIINHHPDDSVRVEFLPILKKACSEGEGSCLEYAKIQDRILVNNQQPQLYGMQFRYNADRELEPFEIFEPEKVNARRKAIGLEPLEHYLKRKINYIWSIEQKKY